MIFILITILISLLDQVYNLAYQALHRVTIISDSWQEVAVDLHHHNTKKILIKTQFTLLQQMQILP